MDYKKILSDAIPYTGASFALRENPQYVLYAIIILTLINKIFAYIMRNHKLTDNDEFVDSNGIIRKNNSTFRK